MKVLVDNSDFLLAIAHIIRALEGVDEGVQAAGGRGREGGGEGGGREEVGKGAEELLFYVSHLTVSWRRV